MFTLKEMVAPPYSLSIQGEHMNNAKFNQVALMATFDSCVSSGYVYLFNGFILLRLYYSCELLGLQWICKTFLQ